MMVRFLAAVGIALAAIMGYNAWLEYKDELLKFFEKEKPTWKTWIDFFTQEHNQPKFSYEGGKLYVMFDDAPTGIKTNKILDDHFELVHQSEKGSVYEVK